MGDNGNSKFQLIKKAKENLRLISLYSEIFNAVKSNNVHKTLHLIKQGVQLTTKGAYDARQFDEDGNSLLHVSSKLGYIEITKILLENGIPVNGINRKEHTPLHWATINEHIDLMKILIDYGADINAKDFEGDTPLHWTAYKGKKESAKLPGKLLGGAGAKFDLYNKNGILPLHWAAYNGDNELIKVFIGHGADIDALTVQGLSVIDCATEHGHTETINLLLELIEIKN